MDMAKLDELIRRCDTAKLTASNVAPFLKELSREEFCDAFSRRVAQEYGSGRMPFEAADAAMNRLWEFAFLGDEAFIPPFSREVFEAFDDGEYHHSGDPSETDPELKYTRPWILEILARGQRA